MFITQIAIERWKGNRNDIEIIKVHQWIDIYKAILELDGKQKTLLTLEVEESANMGVGGGPDLYIVYLTYDNENFYNLTNGTTEEGEVFLDIGGQLGNYKRKRCMDIQKVIIAAKSFAELGEMDKLLIWELDK